MGGFGAGSGRLYEQSPFTLGDLLRQRRRWVWGTLDLLRLDGVRHVFKLVKLLHPASWLAALPSILVAAVNLLAASPIPHPALAPVYGFELANIIYAYLECYKLDTAPADKYNPRRIPILATLIPLVALVEALAPWYALATYHRSRQVGFEVVAK